MACLLAQLGCASADHPTNGVADGAASAGSDREAPGPGGAGGDPSVAPNAAGAGGDDDPTIDGAAGGAGAAPAVASTGLVYAASIESFTPGAGAGFNQSKLPDVVLGPPKGLGTGRGSLDVLSLGSSGEIVLGFGAGAIVDGPGADLIVFENPFWPDGEPSQVFAELGEVSVSEDGETWRAFACDTTGDGEGHYPGCAGVTPTLKFDTNALEPLDAEQTGGDAFDLAELGLARARFVKIRDLATLEPAGTTSGFDLDAVAVIHLGQ
jgi:hypothetical protein